jgi:hypothetical protein
MNWEVGQDHPPMGCSWQVANSAWHQSPCPLWLANCCQLIPSILPPGLPLFSLLVSFASRVLKGVHPGESQFME